MNGPDVLLVVGGSMAVKDVFYTAQEFLVSRKRGLWAGICDAAGDIAGLLTMGVGGYEVATRGLCPMTFLVFGSVAVGSLAGNLVGLRLGVWLEKT